MNEFKLRTFKVSEKLAQKKYRSDFWKIFHTYRYYFLKRFLTWFGDIQIYPAPLWLLLGGSTAYKVNGEDYRNITNLIKEGDIFLRGYRHYLDGYFIPGFYSHAAYYAGKTDKSPQTLIHSMAEGVFAEDIFTFLRCDYVIILRPLLNDDEIADATKRIKSKLGAPYDFDFNFSDIRKFSCTELLYYGLEAFKQRLDLSLKKRYGKETIIPDDFLGIKAKLVYISKYNQSKVKNILKAKGIIPSFEKSFCQAALD